MVGNGYQLALITKPARACGVARLPETVKMGEP